MGYEDTWDMRIRGYMDTVQGILWDTKIQDIGIQGDRDMGTHLRGYNDTGDTRYELGYTEGHGD